MVFGQLVWDCYKFCQKACLWFCLSSSVSFLTQYGAGNNIALQPIQKYLTVDVNNINCL